MLWWYITQQADVSLFGRTFFGFGYKVAVFLAIFCQRKCSNDKYVCIFCQKQKFKKSGGSRGKRMFPVFTLLPMYRQNISHKTELTSSEQVKYRTKGRENNLLQRRFHHDLFSHSPRRVWFVWVFSHCNRDGWKSQVSTA